MPLDDDSFRPVSPDGRWVWTGTGAWTPVSFFPVLPEASTLRPISPDGRWVWNGAGWEAADPAFEPAPGVPLNTPGTQFGVTGLPPGIPLFVLILAFAVVAFRYW